VQPNCTWLLGIIFPYHFVAWSFESVFTGYVADPCMCGLMLAVLDRTSSQKLVNCYTLVLPFLVQCNPLGVSLWQKFGRSTEVKVGYPCNRVFPRDEIARNRARKNTLFHRRFLHGFPLGQGSWCRARIRYSLLMRLLGIKRLQNRRFKRLERTDQPRLCSIM
jgi:hypothetical protein